MFASFVLVNNKLKLAGFCLTMCHTMAYLCWS